MCSVKEPSSVAGGQGETRPIPPWPGRAPVVLLLSAAAVVLA